MEDVGRGLGDPTNNATERVIELTYKIRVKTMRGFKNPDKMLLLRSLLRRVALAHPYLSEYLRGTDGVCDLRQVI